MGWGDPSIICGVSILSDSSLYILGGKNDGVWLNSITSIKIAPLLQADALLQFVFLFQC